MNAADRQPKPTPTRDPACCGTCAAIVSAATRAGSEADTTDTQPTGQECIKVAPDPGHEDEGYSCVTHNCAWDECPTQTEQEADHG